MTELKNKIPDPKQFNRAELFSKLKANKKVMFAAGVLILILVFTFSNFTKKDSVETPAPSPENTVIITAEQAKQIKWGSVKTYDFQERREAVGIIDFDRNKTADIYSPYQGRINRVLANASEDVKKGQILYTVVSPDAAQASANLLSTVGILKTSNETLKRAKELYEFKSISLKELEQNISDQQTAEANFTAAKKTMYLFGFNDAEIEEIVKTRKVDVELNVRSPINGRVITKNAAPGQLVQPGIAPAPFVISDINKLWMVANVPESEVPFYRIGQNVIVNVQAYKDRLFPGKIVYVADSVDPVTRRLTIYAALDDKDHELKPQMLAGFTIELSKPETWPAVPLQALVRENNGLRSVWTTTNGTDFRRRLVRIGILQADLVQILDGLEPGETIALNKALFLSNLYSVTH
ncbi:efflux RND transporter periplasmic adaptor subunit [Polynucleobacter kasalickyi]|uniref:Membrane fusion protein, cobalt-zinc-cadmium efflux system n=1 Tax=Polynucleobacter kasalickyi TaxID=1938817 RepID=A0A1W2A479_9BURK|nr:efflux RND transporter periplasmic adaptor subunit [Polynucleobacter kasalickyi]SMC55221.1 membrane fusion protein, cobalt-zinc-cadmium efflux system [Polynucleobacter kasalickyi]